MTPSADPVGTPRRTGTVTLRLTALAALLALAGIALLGIPGALWMESGAVVAGAFTTRRLAADAAWPMALAITVIWPWFLPLCYLAAAAIVPPGRARRILTLLATAILSTLLAAGFQVASGVLG